MSAGRPYGDEFFDRHRDGSLRSARAIMPLVVDLVQPRSVVDVGCGRGTWLSVFQECGVEDVCGVDGPWVQRDRLDIPADRFVEADLRGAVRLGRRFDLVVSVEVAEHLPPECAETFVGSLTSLGPVVLFSAAIPFQGGRHHVNEQWPEYWAKHFDRHGFRVIDCIRSRVWQDERVEWFYAQNVFLFAGQWALANLDALIRERDKAGVAPLSVVHPRQYLRSVTHLRRLLLLVQDLAQLIPADGSFILVDDAVIRSELALSPRVLPFIERNGAYWGPPESDAVAIAELERLRRGGAGFMVFGWPAFWWLEYYGGLRHHLESRSRCVLRNDRVVAFDLRQ